MTAWRRYSGISCVWLAKLVLPLSMIGWWVGVVRRPANQGILDQSGYQSLTHLCWSSSSTDLRRLLFVEEVKRKAHEEKRDRGRKKTWFKNLFAASEILRALEIILPLEDILLAWSEPELSAYKAHLLVSGRRRQTRSFDILKLQLWINHQAYSMKFLPISQSGSPQLCPQLHSIYMVSCKN